MLAYDYPLLGLFWTMLWVFLWVAWLFILFRVIVDIFRSHDMGGWGKALWVLFVVVVPFLGVFVYLIARGRQMTERDSRTPRTGMPPSVRTSRTRPVPRPAAPPRSCPSSPISRPRASSPTPSSSSRRPRCWPEAMSIVWAALIVVAATAMAVAAVLAVDLLAARPRGQIRPSRRPASTASLRDATSSLRYTLRTWDFSVLSDTYSAAAISRYVSRLHR